MADAAQVVLHVRGLHLDTANVQAHSQWLQDFQQVSEAWVLVRELLTGSTDEPVQFFAAQTLVTKLQAGQPPALNGCSWYQDIFQYLSRYQRGPAAVRRQLVVALVDYALWRPAQEDAAWLNDSVKQLSESTSSLLCLLELLAIIPEEAANRKVVVEAQRRSTFAANMLQHTNSAMEALWKASQSEPSAIIAVLQACARWLGLQHASPALRAQKRAGGGVGGGSGPFCADIVSHGSLHEHPLLRQAAQTLSNISSAPLELCRASADVLSEAHALTNETTPQARPLQMLVLQAVVAGSRQLLPLTQANLENWMEPDSELASRAAVLGRLVGELGGMFARLSVAIGVLDASAVETPLVQEMSSLLNDLSGAALHFCQLRHTDLAKCGLDFWYMVLSQHLGALTEEDDPFDEEASFRLASDNFAQAGRSNDQTAARREEEKPFLNAAVQRMVEAHWKAVRYPPEPEQERNFEWDEFVRFRELCAINVTEACLIVTPRWIIDYVGQVLEKICSGPIAWQDIDACVFLLTAVASRAPAGQDTVIPKLIELLPQLPYPTQGFKAMLLRCAASRLVLFTSGYLALNPEPCKQILRFLTMQHLPAIPGLPPGPDPDAKKYSEALACDAMKMVMTAARKAIVQADNGTMWKDVVTAVIALVADSRFTVDCRAQLVFGIGQVLSVLENWDELEHMLGQFVSRMQEPLQPIFDKLPAEPLGASAQKLTRDGKAPLELKLYIAALSSVYNIPARTNENGMNRPDHHPVLAVVEQHFPTIERVCIHHTQYDELMEQVCLAFSYILGFAREYAPTSPVFVPMMKLMARCCEYHPQPFYLGLVRSVIGFFATNNNDQLHMALVDLTGLFIRPVIQRLVGAVGGGQQPLPTAINTAGFEMLSEAMRHWNLALLAMQKAAWLPDVLDGTIRVLPYLADANQVVHERTICSMLRFIRNMLLWGDPETLKGDNAPELLELQKQAQVMLRDGQLPGGLVLPRLVTVLAQLLAAAASHAPSKGEVVPSIADVLQKFFSGPFEYIVSSQLPNAFRQLPPPLNTALADGDMQRLIQQLKMERGDARRFARSIVGMAENFAVCIKKAQFR